MGLEFLVHISIASCGQTNSGSPMMTTITKFYK